MSELDKDRKFVLKGSLINFLGTGLKIICPILAFLVARFFGAEAFGIYISTQFWVSMVSRVAVFGLDRGLIWYIPQNQVHGRHIYEGIQESLWCSAMFAFVITLVFAIGSHFNLHKLFSGLVSLSSTEITLYILSLIPWVFLHIFAGASEGNRKPQFRVFINDFAVYTMAPVIALSFLWIGYSRYALPLGLFIANTLAAIIYIFFIRKQFPGLSWVPKFKVPRELFIYSIPIGFSEFVVSFLLRVDLWAVLITLGPKSAGVYAIMITISNGLRTISMSFNSILLPIVAKMDSIRLKTDLPNVYSYCVSMTTLIQLGIGFFIVIFPKETLMVAGKSFVSEPEVLGLLLFANLYAGFFGLSGTVLNGIGKSKFLLNINIVSLGLALLMNLLLVPRFGLVGAALSTCGVRFLQGTWMAISLRYQGLWPYKRYLWVQAGWIVVIVGTYILMNSHIEFSYFIKIPAFSIFVIGLLITLIKQGLLDSKYNRSKKEKIGNCEN